MHGEGAGGLVRPEREEGVVLGGGGGGGGRVGGQHHLPGGGGGGCGAGGDCVPHPLLSQRSVPRVRRGRLHQKGGIHSPGQRGAQGPGPDRVPQLQWARQTGPNRQVDDGGGGTCCDFAAFLCSSVSLTKNTHKACLLISTRDVMRDWERKRWLVTNHHLFKS